MNTRPTLFALLTTCILLAGCATLNTDPGDARSAYGVGGRAQLFDNMGDYSRPITTRSAKAQQYFDQGLNWLYGFNHDEAVRSFTRAAQLDPTSAMAWWGVAYAQGPNYNDAGMSDARKAAAWDALQKALAQLDDETPAEQTLVRTLTHRYHDPDAAQDAQPQTDSRADFAAAMAEAWAAYPNDPDIGTFYAESLMLKHPWALYKPDTTPARDETLTIVATLEQVLTFAPNHPGANHYYIHAVEASADKQRGLPAADRLGSLVPLSGHLTHMPCHLYVQLGLWDRAVEQSVLATQADAIYLSLSPTQFRQTGYAAHNGHMLAFAAMMVGREQDALAGARAVWDIPDDLFPTMGRRYDRALCSIYDVLKRFGRWDEILAQPAPPDYLSRTFSEWRACRAIAFAAKKDFENAATEQAAFRELLAARPNDRFLKLNDLFIAGEIALQQEQWDQAAQLLEEAAAIEDTLGYGEPPNWLQPIRHTLGAVYLKAQRYDDAERAFREDLAHWPDNGWSLFGLTRALESQGKIQEAATTRAAFNRTWAKADNPLTTSCECIPEL